MNQRKASVLREDVTGAVRDGLEAEAVDPTKSPAIVLFSGGGDSVALLLAATEIFGPEKVFALHVNYALRAEESDADEVFCREFCERAGVFLSVHQAPPFESGNLQDWARDIRYEAAAELAAELGDDAVILVAHTADDQAETIIYRLFASPGRRALKGIPQRRGRIVRPLLRVRRARLRAWLEERGEAWREDESNYDDQFARVRARKLIADAEALHPAAVANLLLTAADLQEEGEALDAITDELLADAAGDDGSLDLERLAAEPPALAGLVLRAFTEHRLGRPVPKAARVFEEALRLARAGGRRELQIEGASIWLERGRAYTDPL